MNQVHLMSLFILQYLLPLGLFQATLLMLNMPASKLTCFDLQIICSRTSLRRMFFKAWRTGIPFLRC